MSTAYTESQYANLYGRSEGLLNEEVTIEIINNTSPQKVRVICNGSSKTSNIPNDANVSIYMRHNLRLKKVDLGINSDVFKDSKHQSKFIDVGSLFGVRWKKIKWELKITTSDEPGRCWAWTKNTPLLSGKSLIKHNGESILKLRTDELPDEIAWEIDFPDEDAPTIVVNSEINNFASLIKTDSLVSSSLLPEIISNILDQIISNYAEMGSIGNNSYTWEENWLNFIKNKFTDTNFPSSGEFGSEMVIDLMNWKRNVVKHMKNYINQKTKLIQIISNTETGEGYYE